MVLVKVGRIGSTIKEYALPGGCSGNMSDVATALVAAKIKLQTDDDVLLQGVHRVDLNRSIVTGDLIIVQKRTSEKLITIKVGRVGEPLTLTKIINGATIREALVKCGKLPLGNEELWLHSPDELKGMPANNDLILKEGDVVIIEKVNTVTRVLHYLEEIIDDAGGDPCDMDLNEAAEEMVEICKKR